MTPEFFSDKAHHIYKLKASLAVREDIYMCLEERVWAARRV
jgi:hypothetical protein